MKLTKLKVKPAKQKVKLAPYLRRLTSPKITSPLLLAPYISSTFFAVVGVRAAGNVALAITNK